MHTIWVQGALALRARRKRPDNELLGTTRVHLEVEIPRDRVFPQLRERVSFERLLSRACFEQWDLLTTGNVLTLVSSHSGSSSMGSSRPSDSIPKPVGMARAGVIQT